VTNSWSHNWYRVYRVIFGVYLLQHFLWLLPWGVELFSSAGILPEASMSPLLRLFPNVFLVSDSPLFVQLCVVAAALCSVLLILGKFDRVMAVLIWYLWACFYGRNPMIANPSLPFIGWLLLAYAAIPPPSRVENAAEQRLSQEWKLPSQVFLAAWIVMSLAYLYSGYTKLVSPSWVDGTALTRVLSNPLARDTVLRSFLLGLPPISMKLATWSVLALELTFAPLAIFRRVRPFVWTAMVSLHLALLVLINFADLTLGMLLVHTFTFDASWVRSFRWASSPSGDGWHWWQRACSRWHAL